jgi:hypothetical protein
MVHAYRGLAPGLGESLVMGCGWGGDQAVMEGRL